MTTDDDLNALMPEQSIEIAGQSVIVRELTFKQGLQFAERLTPLITDLAQTATAGDEITADSAVNCLHRHPDLLMDLLEATTGLPRSTLDNLTDDDGYNLVLVFFGVHASFFGKRLLTAAVQRDHLAKLKTAINQNHGAQSSLH